jgi:hypothetical protein
LGGNWLDFGEGIDSLTDAARISLANVMFVVAGSKSRVVALTDLKDI